MAVVVNSFAYKEAGGSGLGVRVGVAHVVRDAAQVEPDGGGGALALQVVAAVGTGAGVSVLVLFMLLQMPVMSSQIAAAAHSRDGGLGVGGAKQEVGVDHGGGVDAVALHAGVGGGGYQGRGVVDGV